MERSGEAEAALGARRADLSAAPPGAVAFAAVVGLAVADGGYFPQAWGWAALALLWAAAAAVVLRSGVELGRLELAVLGLVTAFTGWTLLTALWAESVPLAVREAERTLVYVAGLAALLLAARRGSERWILGGVLLAAAAVAALNLLRDRLAAIDPGLQGAFAWPIGYPNGLAVLLALAIAVAAGLAVRTRGVSLLAVPLLAVPLAATESRAAFLALAAGGLALLAARSRLALASVLVAALVAAGALGWAVGSERESYWRVAGTQVAADPVLGGGAGSFARVWVREREAPLMARDAHSLYLETLAETGPVGLLLLVGALGLPLLGASRAPRAATGGYVVFLVHAGVDWDWELPVVALAGIACGAALLVARRPERATAVPRLPALAALAVLAAVTVPPLVAHARLAASAEAASESRWQASAAAARAAARWAPWEAEPWLRRGLAEDALGMTAPARRSLRTAVEKDPRNPDLWRALARVETGEERRRALVEAALLDPFGTAG